MVASPGVRGPQVVEALADLGDPVADVFTGDHVPAPVHQGEHRPGMPAGRLVGASGLREPFGAEGAHRLQLNEDRGPARSIADGRQQGPVDQGTQLVGEPTFGPLRHQGRVRRVEPATEHRDPIEQVPPGGVQQVVRPGDHVVQ